MSYGKTVPRIYILEKRHFHRFKYKRIIVLIFALRQSVDFILMLFKNN